MIAIRLDKAAEERLAECARQAGRSKASFAREALLQHLEDLEDAKLAVERLRAGEATFSAAEVRRELGL